MACPDGYIDKSANPQITVGMKPIEILDIVVNYATKIGLKVILDHHTVIDNTPQGLWYVPGSDVYTAAKWQADWQMLAQRYVNTSVIGADLNNEPYLAHWGSDPGTVNGVPNDATDWAAAATSVGNAILAKNPNWLIIVEGVTNYNNSSNGMSGYWSGGNLQGVASQPITLNLPNKVVYSPHDYGPSVYQQPWFSNSSYPTNLPSIYDAMWGYIYKDNIAPIWVGEFGSSLVVDNDNGTWTASTADQQYMTAILNYMGQGLTASSAKKPMSWDVFAWWTSGTYTEYLPNGGTVEHPTDTMGIVGPYAVPSNSDSDPGNTGMWTTTTPIYNTYVAPWLRTYGLLKA